MTRHVGDLGNVKTSEGGLTRFRIQDSKISLEDGANNSIIGLAVVIHEGTNVCNTFYGAGMKRRKAKGRK